MGAGHSSEDAGHKPSALLEIVPLPEGIVCEKNVEITLSDGAVLKANVYRPAVSDDEQKQWQFPVLLHCVPYGKDDTCHDHILFKQVPLPYNMMWMFGGKFGTIKMSTGTPWESMDPAVFVPRGYVCVHVDSRGFHASSGPDVHGEIMGKREARDYCEVITWAGTQPWSDGNVGTIGVSYLAISQWYGAAECGSEEKAEARKYWKAMCPWEGFTKVYEDFGFPGGVGPHAFAEKWITTIGQDSKGGAPEDLWVNFQNIMKNGNLYDDWCKTKEAVIEDIDIPALVCATFSDQGVHNPGTFNAWRRLKKNKKWLFTHGRTKWEEFYKSTDFQLEFFDHFLKGRQTSFPDLPPVRLEVRETMFDSYVRYENSWPLERQKPWNLFFANSQNLLVEEVKDEGSVFYDAKKGTAKFLFKFQQDTEITGYGYVRLWVSVDGHNEMDLLVQLRKLDAQGNVVSFAGVMGDQHEGVAKGFFRVSHHVSKLDAANELEPLYSHASREDLVSNTPVSVDVSLYPSSTLFRKDETLEVTIAGHSLNTFPMLLQNHLNNAGTHRIHYGGKYDSFLCLPLIEDGAASCTEDNKHMKSAERKGDRQYLKAQTE
eukprot:TRINITY_DN6865_c0_g1_i1.p1 TRINITY_DN6865_c0_g1~~TRINITY_DN6865_c0_g1_i1.p1  ORF type:complete len:599 (-),score=153.73 TRINITY_DN6865_c0_g1_i1:27-1823(-)